MRVLVLFLIISSKALALQTVIIDTVYASTRMNTVIAMPSKVLVVDPGSPDYAVKYLEDMVIFKAKTVNAKPTSLLVKSLTVVNIWIIAYRDIPPQLLVKFNPPDGAGSLSGVDNQIVVNVPAGDNPVRPGKLEGRRPNIAIRKITVPIELSQRVQELLNKPRMYSDIGQKLSGIYFMLGGIYLDADYIYFQILIKNTTQISYEMDLVSFEHNYAQKAGKRKQAIKPNVYVPEYFHTVNVVLPEQEECVVYLLPIYAFNEKDVIKARMTEKEGERLIYFDFTGKDILNGQRL